ncbi:hypothetical protein C8R43DRAFT_270839 [Mycena crocata]|nr:hypothetical protein C8R43DRAFT_270839 [Mycena crocata]
MSLAEIPLDAILELTFFLDLQDSIRLLLTCRAFESLFSLKDFWLKTLDRIHIVYRQPLPCPPEVDLAALLTDDLRKIAIHAYSLKKNWSVERPVPVSVHTFPLHSEYQQLCVIPGTDLIVTNSHKRFACWNTRSGERLAMIEHEDAHAGYSIGRAPPFQLPGHYLIGLSSKSREDLALLVIRIDYKNPHDIILTKTYLKIFDTEELQPISFPDVALDDKMIGMVFTSYIDEATMLVYCDFETDVVHRVHLGPRLGSIPVCMLHNGYFYVNGQDLDEDSTVVRVRALRSADEEGAQHDIECVTPHIAAPDLAHHPTSLSFPQLLPPKYGVLNVTRASWAANPRQQQRNISSIHFWPVADTPLKKSPLKFGELPFCEHRAETTGLVTGVSGRYAAVVEMGKRANGTKPRHGIALVHCVAHPVPRTSAHRLDTGGVTINFYTAVIALDDARGVVYVTHLGQGAAATLSVFAYA